MKGLGMSKVLGHLGTSAPGCHRDHDLATQVPKCLCDLVPIQSLIPFHNILRE